MKKFFGEFKKFITRGNVVDMAVGVTVGSAFTAIVNALSNSILKPIINWVLALVLGKNSLSEVFTFLKKSYVMVDSGKVDEITGETIFVKQVDLANSIYIDWGAFINAIINFILIAFVLFMIVRFVNKVKDRQQALAASAKKNKLTKEEKAEMKAQGLNPRDKAQVKSYRAAVAKAAEEKAAAEAIEAERKAKEEAEKAAYAAAANDRQEAILKEICELLKNK